MKIRFLGANRQVTGSRHGVEIGDRRYLVDCGMFQERDFRDRNWNEPTIPPKDLDGILLTHAHLDHSGLLPRAVKQGFHGPIFATEPTVDITEVILRDSAKIQAEDAEYKRKRHEREGRKGKHPYEPLYTNGDVDRTMSLFHAVRYGEPVPVDDGVAAVYHEAGHILGSAMIELLVQEGGATRRVIFSGDIGQLDKPYVNDPTTFAEADTVVLESTYGNRDHPDISGNADIAAAAVQHAVENKGKVLVPAFAVERAQEVLFHIGELVRAGRIPSIPVFLDSPMAVNVTEIFRKFRSWFDEETKALFTGKHPLIEGLDLKLVRSVAESQELNDIDEACIIVSSSGMCTGGRIKHHLIHSLPHERNCIVFVGYQAHGTLGREIAEGADDVRIHGRRWPVRAKRFRLDGLSAHAGRQGLLDWVDRFETPPKHIFLTHGEEDAALALAKTLRERHPSSEVVVPEYGQVIDLGTTPG